jgi:hypothetical protein
VGCDVIEIPWVSRVVTSSLGIGIVVEHCVQTEVVEIRKRKAWAGVKESVARKIVEVDAVASIIGIKPIFVAHIEVVDEVLVRQVAVVAERRSVWELKIVNAVA